MQRVDADISAPVSCHATGIAVDLENKGRSETVQKVAGASFQSAFRYFIITYKCA